MDVELLAAYRLSAGAMLESVTLTSLESSAAPALPFAVLSIVRGLNYWKSATTGKPPAERGARESGKQETVDWIFKSKMWSRGGDSGCSRAVNWLCPGLYKVRLQKVGCCQE
jgi:hypothetical protein